MPHPIPRPPQGALSRQLPLPLALPAQPHLGTLAPPLTTVAVHQIWPHLSPMLQTHVRSAVLRVLQEAVHDAPR